ncbi:MAG: heme-copper oxidase subunit III [Chitinophagales bacterium]|jgi:cytochrome c oxidase subunit 3
MTTAQREDQQLLFHPYNIMLVLLLFGLSMLFLALTLSYAYTKVTMGVGTIQVPPLFYLNTLVLLGSSYTMVRAQRAYLRDDTAEYQKSLQQTIWLSVVFMGLQAITWTWLFKINQVSLSSSTAAGYLYVISIVHLLHVVAGLPFIYLFLKAAKKHMIDPVTVLVYFSDPEKRLKLRLLTLYWHFLDLLWIYLVVFLLVMSFF